MGIQLDRQPNAGFALENEGFSSHFMGRDLDMKSTVGMIVYWDKKMTLLSKVFNHISTNFCMFQMRVFHG